MKMDTDKSQSMRVQGETDRSAEFKLARAELLGAVDTTFDEVWAAQDATRQFKFGSAVFGQLGVKREVVADPFGGPAMMQESTMSHPGLRVATDPNDGQEVIFIRRPDKSTIEIRRNPLLQATALPVNLEDDWKPLEGSGHELVASFIETQPDGSALGYSIAASGSITLRTSEAGRHGMNRTAPLPTGDAEPVEAAAQFFDTLRQDVFLDTV